VQQQGWFQDYNMSDNVSWFGDGRKKPKEIVGKAKDGIVGVGKLLIAGLALGIGLKAFGSAMD